MELSLFKIKCKNPPSLLKTSCDSETGIFYYTWHKVLYSRTHIDVLPRSAYRPRLVAMLNEIDLSLFVCLPNRMYEYSIRCIKGSCSAMPIQFMREFRSENTTNN